MNELLKIQAATNAARQRMADKTIGTRVDAGKIQVIRVTYPHGPKAVINPVSDWMAVSEVCGYLAALQ